VPRAKKNGGPPPVKNLNSLVKVIRVLKANEIAMTDRNVDHPKVAQSLSLYAQLEWPAMVKVKGNFFRRGEMPLFKACLGASGTRLISPYFMTIS